MCGLWLNDYKEIWTLRLDQLWTTSLFRDFWTTGKLSQPAQMYCAHTAYEQSGYLASRLWPRQSLQGYTELTTIINKYGIWGYRWMLQWERCLWNSMFSNSSICKLHSEAATQALCSGQLQHAAVWQKVCCKINTWTSSSNNMTLTFSWTLIKRFYSPNLNQSAFEEVVGHVVQWGLLRGHWKVF